MLIMLIMIIMLIPILQPGLSTSADHPRYVHRRAVGGGRGDEGHDQDLRWLGGGLKT